jgi:hypothetical protein
MQPVSEPEINIDGHGPVPEGANCCFADWQRVFDQALVEPLVKSDAGFSKLKLIVVVCVLIGKNSVMDEAAVGDKGLLGADAEESEAAQAETP